MAGTGVRITYEWNHFFLDCILYFKVKNMLMQKKIKRAADIDVKSCLYLTLFK